MPWREQVVVVKGSFNRQQKRLCINYSQTVNIYTQPDAYPHLQNDDMINELSQYSVFSTFDLRSAYYQIELFLSERKYTGFEANAKSYEFTRIPLGVKNGVAAFQRSISQFIKEEKLSNTYAYLNNVTVTGSTQLEHDYNLRAFIDAIRRQNFKLNKNKTFSSVSDIKTFIKYLTKVYLHPTSSYSPHIFASIVFSQALRYKRIYSDRKEFNLQLTTLKNAFTTLGYKPKTVKNQITKAMSIPREALLKYETKSECDRTPLVLTYNPLS